MSNNINTGNNNIRVQDSLVDTDFKAIDSYGQMADLDIICNHCSVFDSKAVLRVKRVMRYDARNERFICETCRRVVGEKQVRTVLHLNEEEYIHYEKATPIRQTLQKRMDKENYIIKPNNPVPLNDPSLRARAIVLNNRNNKAVDRDNEQNQHDGFRDGEF
jgi:hypothetical protein